MNREIKFRGKRVDNDEWVYGSLIYDVNEKWYIHQNNFVFWAGYCEIIPETIGQFTGLKDKNSKKIYEGDIIEYKDSTGLHRETVVFDKGCFFAGWHCGSSTREAPKLINTRISTVIGNIYESEVTNANTTN